MNETMNTLLTRRSIRTFNDKPIPQEVLDQILQAGIYAPTARGEQNPIIIVITDKDFIAKLSAENAKIMGREGADPFYGAKTILLVASKATANAVYDGSCVISNLMNAAWSLGVGSCWIHRARQELETDFGKEILRRAGVEEGEYVGIGHVALGYFDGEVPQPKPRKQNWIYHI